MFNLFSDINTDTLASSVTVIVLFTILTIALALVAVFLIGKYHAVAEEDTEKVGKLKTVYMIGIIFAVGLLIRLLLTFLVNGEGSNYSRVYELANNVVKINGGFDGYTTGFIGIAPLTGYLYALFTGMGINFGVGQDEIMMQLFVKLPYLLADIATFFVIYYIAHKYVNRYVALVIAGLYYLNPLFFVMSSMWGSEYSLLILAVLLMLWFLLKKNVFGMVVATSAAVLISPDAVFLAPVVAVYLIYLLVKAIIKIVRTKPSFDMLFKDSTLYNVFYVPLCIVLGFALIYLVSLPAYFPDGVVGFGEVMSQLFVKPFLYASGEGALYYFSENGLSIYTIFTQNYKTLGTNFPTLLFVGLFIALIVAIVLVVFLLRRNRANILLLASFVALTVSIYFMGANEWAITPSLILMLFGFAVAKDKRILKVFTLLSVFVTLNALLAMLGGNQITSALLPETFSMASDGVLNTFSILLSVLTVLTHIYYTVIVLDVSLTKHRTLFATDRLSSFGEVMGNWVRG